MANLFFFSTRKYWYLGVNEAKVERNVIVTRWQFFWFEFAKKKKKREKGRRKGYFVVENSRWRHRLVLKFKLKLEMVLEILTGI